MIFFSLNMEESNWEKLDEIIYALRIVSKSHHLCETLECEIAPN